MVWYDTAILYIIIPKSLITFRTLEEMKQFNVGTCLINRATSISTMQKDLTFKLGTSAWIRDNTVLDTTRRSAESFSTHFFKAKIPIGKTVKVLATLIRITK